MTVTGQKTHDLVLLVADKDMEYFVSGLLTRPNDIGISEINCNIIPYVSRHDPGCCRNSHNFLRAYSTTYSYALVLFDHHGSGRENDTVQIIQDDVEKDLSRSGWGNRAKAVVISPELENWIWSRSSRVAACLGWKGQSEKLGKWLEEKGEWAAESSKPEDPKRAVELALRKARKPRSSRIYRDLAERVSLEGCIDPAFLRLRNILREWFPRNM